MTEPFASDSVAGLLDAVPGAAAAMVLAHGAGSDCRAPLLARVAEAFNRAGVTVLRCDLPFRQRRRQGPPHPSEAAADREGLRHAAAAMRRLAPGRLILGGHSYGGRQASMLAAEDPQLADGLLLLSYPLHPPRHRASLRTAHFPSLRTPAVFVHGARDPFGSPTEMEAAVALIPGPHRLFIVPGGHDLSGFSTAGEAAISTLLAQFNPTQR
ncbi:MAG: alpha/beta fold hydrolase [Acidobacteria bacterium]|nr:alpha/beta fold hydrolase [Acidobacteriota bacterium]